MDIKKSFYLIFSSFLAGVFIFMSIKPGLYLSYFKGAVIFGSFLFSLNFLKIFSIESLSKQTFINSLMVLLILFVISFFMSLKKIWAEDDIT